MTGREGAAAGAGTSGGGSSEAGVSRAGTSGAGSPEAGSPEAGPSDAGSSDAGAPAAPTVLVLLRHGESELTAQKRFSGSGGSDPALSEHGRWQAGRAAAELAVRGGVQAVVSSPLARCRETAQAAADRLGLDVAVEPGLRETDFGAWEGLTFAEVRERHPAELDAWFASADAAPSGGESFTEVAARVAAARDALLAAHRGRTVLVVSHVTPITTLVRLALDAPAGSLFRMQVGPASLSEIAYYADGNASVRQLNADVHLRP
ncbi:probable phosphoglycerate mutase [Actinacidiphila rubida]|uniref:Probable phosphoglycerate mutase n=1 Tax=Actinacidiphila rubida TaxID=310780 RepID=A0A1H8FG79_9ACTN|nr:probable phosphoglycerate mutase [Actinacidiphila rubida]